MLANQIIVSAWNAVNVCGNDGRLQRGLVVDKTDSGLWIDFGIPDKEPELFSVDRVFSHTATISSLAPGGEILFLYQLSRKDPWTWYPAKILAASDAVFVLVEFVWENVHVRDIFPWRRFQGFYPYPYNGPYLVQFHGKTPNFSKTDVAIPEGLKEKEHFMDLWKIAHTYPVDIEGNKFSYIYDSHIYDSQQNQHLKNKLALHLVPRCMNAAQAMADIGRLGRSCSCQALLATVAEEMSIADLPLDIVTEVFSYMNCIEHTLLRRVSTDWNDIIESLSSEIVRVDLSVFNHWRMAVSLHKCLTSFTKYVLFVGDVNSPDYGVIFGPSHTATLVQLASVAMTKLTAIVVTAAVIAEDFVHRDKDPAFSEAFQAICGRVILRDVSCSLDFSCEGIPGQIDGPNVFIACCKYDASDKNSMADAFEDFFTEMDFEDFGSEVTGSYLDVMAQFLQLAGNEDQDGDSHLLLQEALLQIIKKRQRDDARFGPDCSWVHVEAAGLLQHVDSLRTLRKTTLAVLVAVIVHLLDAASPPVE